MNRRRYPRFRLVTPLPVAVEHGSQITGGRLMDVSRSGAQIGIKGLFKVNQPLLLEVLSQGLVAPVHVVRVDHGNLGVSFDRSQDGESLVKAVMGLDSHVCMEARGDVAYFKGNLSFLARRDFLFASAHFPVIDLSGVNRLDTAGLALCLIGMDRHGVRLQGCPDDCRSLLGAGKICDRCVATHRCAKAVA